MSERRGEGGVVNWERVRLAVPSPAHQLCKTERKINSHLFINTHFAIVVCFFDNFYIWYRRTLSRLTNSITKISTEKNRLKYFNNVNNKLYNIKVDIITLSAK